jgi:NAD(P)-dependent dehydrogenase (short-subunit alcohol dehydrogenase family)
MLNAQCKPLRGKTCLITGGAKRLGRASALAVAQAGADVAITFLDSRREAQHTVVDLASFGVRAFALHCDVTDESSVKSMMEEAGRELGRIDILINNAAQYATVDFGRLTVNQWDEMFATNTRGPFLVSREALQWMRRKRPGSKQVRPKRPGLPGSASKGWEPVKDVVEAKIINMGSLGGLRPWATHAHYCSSKAALHMLTKVMAKALAPEIAVNAIAPGMIDLGEKSAASFMKRMATQTPMRRNGRAYDVAAAVLFFATAPQFITGQILTVDGGLGL